MKRLIVKYGWLAASVLIILGYLMLFRTAEVSGSSMEPTYQSKDMLLLYRTSSVEPGDIITIYSHDLNKLICKRVIGVAGDHVVITNAGLSINGVYQSEPYVSTESWPASSKTVTVDVPDGEIFVMGDNRVVSTDSRDLGCLPLSDIVGVVVVNVTKAFGIKRDALIRAVTVLIVLSIGYDLYTRLRKVDDRNIAE